MYSAQSCPIHIAIKLQKAINIMCVFVIFFSFRYNCKIAALIRLHPLRCFCGSWCKKTKKNIKLCETSTKLATHSVRSVSFEHAICFNADMMNFRCYCITCENSDEIFFVPLFTAYKVINKSFKLFIQILHTTAIRRFTRRSPLYRS